MWKSERGDGESGDDGWDGPVVLRPVTADSVPVGVVGEAGVAGYFDAIAFGCRGCAGRGSEVQILRHLQAYMHGLVLSSVVAAEVRRRHRCYSGMCGW